MTEQQVVELMKSSKNENEWNANCDTVRRAHDRQYPSFWYSAVIASGLAARVQAGWLSEGSNG